MSQNRRNPWTTGRSLNVFQYQLVLVYVWSEFCMGTAEDPSLRFFAVIHMKDQVHGNVFGETPSNRISHYIIIVRTSCSQFPTRSEIFCFLVAVVYWPSDLKFVYLSINLAFLGIIVKVKLLRFFFAQFWMIFSPIKSWRKIFFPPLSKALWSRVNSYYRILFSKLKQKEIHYY